VKDMISCLLHWYCVEQLS